MLPYLPPYPLLHSMGCSCLISRMPVGMPPKGTLAGLARMAALTAGALLAGWLMTRGAPLLKDEVWCELLCFKCVWRSLEGRVGCPQAFGPRHLGCLYEVARQ